MKRLWALSLLILIILYAAQGLADQDHCVPSKDRVYDSNQQHVFTIEDGNVYDGEYNLRY